MKTSSSKSILITLAILILALAGANYAFYYVIRSSGQEVSSLQQQNVALQTQVQEFSKYRPEDLKQLAQSVIAKIIPRGDFVNFIEDVESNARTQGIGITVETVNVLAHTSDANDDKQILRLNLNTSGTWQQTMRFISYLEHLPYKISITQMNVVKNDGQDKKNTDDWHGTFEVTALKFK